MKKLAYIAKTTKPNPKTGRRWEVAHQTTKKSRWTGKVSEVSNEWTEISDELGEHTLATNNVKKVSRTGKYVTIWSVNHD